MCAVSGSPLADHLRAAGRWGSLRISSKGQHDTDFALCTDSLYGARQTALSAHRQFVTNATKLLPSAEVQQEPLIA